MMSMFAQVFTRETIFGIEQWKVGSGLVLLATLILLLIPKGKGIKVLTSLRLTIWTLGISVLLVFLGSVAQVNEGLWNAQARWFKSWFVFKHAGDPWWVPPIFPGGHLLGTVLLINLLSAHAKRFVWTFQKVGIQITHLGIIMLLVGQFMTDELAVESMLSFREGETKQYTEHHRDSEMIFTTDTADGQEQVVAVPDSIIAKKGDIQNSALPFTVKIHQYAVNGDVLERSKVLEVYGQLKGALDLVESKYGSGDLVELAREVHGSEGRADVWRAALRAVGDKDFTDIVAGAQRAAADPAVTAKLRIELKQRFRKQMLEANMNPNSMRDDAAEAFYAAEALKDGRELTEQSLPAASTDGVGTRAVVIPRPEQKDDKARNLPFAVIEAIEGGKSLGKWVVSQTIRRQDIEAGGKKWQVAMRFERFYLPFTMKLLKANHDVYQGTDIPKDYRSRVLLENSATGEKRETEIYMNQPLRYAGLTFYQSQMGEDQRNRSIKTSGLQVVENPSWLTPYAGCLVVGLGMMWQFLWQLSKFFSKRAGLPSPEVACMHPVLPIAAVIFVLPDLWVFFKGWSDGSGMTMVAVGCTLILRLIIAWQLARGRYLGFALVFLAVTTMLLVPFALKYHEAVGAMLWPLVAAQTFVIAAVVIAITSRRTPVTITT
jgi:hypothetical protein